MIIYNTTFQVPEGLQNEFLTFLRDEYIPLATKGDIMKEARLTRIFGQDEDEGYSFALEFKADNLESLEKWNNSTGKKLYLLVLHKFKQSILGFATLLQPIDL